MQKSIIGWNKIIITFAVPTQLSQIIFKGPMI